MAVGDFNGDGKPDLALADVGSNTVSVLLGNGLGSFRIGQNFAVGASFPTGTTGQSVQRGLSGDGKLDLAVANDQSTRRRFCSAMVTGLSSPKRSTRPGSNSNPDALAVRDINGDGKQDIVVADNGSNAISVLLGNGDGTFAPHSSFRPS